MIWRRTTNPDIIWFSFVQSTDIDFLLVKMAKGVKKVRNYHSPASQGYMRQLRSIIFIAMANLVCPYSGERHTASFLGYLIINICIYSFILKYRIDQIAVMVRDSSMLC